MSQGSSSTGASACRQQCQRNDSCLCQGDKPAVPTGISVPAFSTFMPQRFKTSCSRAQRKGWRLPHGTCHREAQRIPRDKHTVLRTLPRRVVCFGRAGALLLQTAAVHTYTAPGAPDTEESHIFSGTLQKGTIQQHVLGHLPTQPKSCPASLCSSAPHPPAPPHATGSTQDHFTSAERTSPPLQIPHSLSLGAQFQAAIKQLSTEVNQNYTHFHQPQIWPNFAKNT